MKCHIHIAILLACCLLMTVPAFGHGNIYLTGHDLDFHCALQPPPTSCNAFKIAVLFRPTLALLQRGLLGMWWIQQAQPLPATAMAAHLLP